MRVALKPHPDTPCEAVRTIEVEVVRSKLHQLTLTFVVRGDLDGVIWPAFVEGLDDRVDELWKHTCFEAFVRAPGSNAYTELNVAPSAQWAAYQFSGYREGMEMARWALFTFEFSEWPDRAEARARFDGLMPDKVLLAVSAVIEETSGRKSYWALAHPAGKPDFHHPDAFVLDLPAEPS